jgi:hypothetical protein
MDSQGAQIPLLWSGDVGSNVCFYIHFVPLGRRLVKVLCCRTSRVTTLAPSVTAHSLLLTNSVSSFYLSYQAVRLLLCPTDVRSRR